MPHGIQKWYEISRAVVNYLIRDFATPAYFQCPLQHVRHNGDKYERNTRRWGSDDLVSVRLICRAIRDRPRCCDGYFVSPVIAR